MKILKILLIFLLFWLQYALWFGKNGIFDYIKIYKKVQKDRKVNDNLDIINNLLQLEIKKMHHENLLK